ncbi:MAG: DUF1833 family protein [Xanthobacteraceae bacterium]
MPDPTLNEVMEEAYASASPDKIIIETISFYHAGMVNGLGNPDEVYLFNGNNGTSVTEEGIPLLSARIEPSAARNAGQVVTFLGRPFAITLPSMRDEVVASAALAVDSVNREMHNLLETAAKGGKQIEVTYRSYIKGVELDGPQSLPPKKFILTGVTASGNGIAGRLAFLAIGNRPFPFDTYRPDKFKTLQYG